MSESVVEENGVCACMAFAVEILDHMVTYSGRTLDVDAHSRLLGYLSAFASNHSWNWDKFFHFNDPFV
jgi:hypothetical protein